MKHLVLTLPICLISAPYPAIAELDAGSPADAAVEDDEHAEDAGMIEEDNDKPGLVVEYAPSAQNDEKESSGPSSTIQGVVNFAGLIREKGTRAPVGEVTVYLKDTDYQATTQTDGQFEFRDLPPGQYRAVIPTLDYEKFETIETVAPGERTDVKYYLEPKVYGALEVVVRGKKVEKEVSRTVIKMKEAEAVAGLGGDAVKVVETMPGVARGVGGDGIVIRGSNAEDSKIYLDGHEIPILFHFGGIKSVYNSSLLDEINLYTGGFSAQFGEATGGVIELKTRKPRLDRWGGYVDTSFIDATAMAEGPLTEDMGLALAVRRSTTDLILNAVDPDIDGMTFTTYPFYYDYQAKWHYKIDDNHSVGIDFYGLHEEMSMGLDTVDDADPEISGGIGDVTSCHGAFIHYDFQKDGFHSHLSPGITVIYSKWKIGDFFIREKDYLLDFNEDIRIDLTKNNTLAIGLRVQRRYADLRANMILPPKEGDVDTSFSNSPAVNTSIADGDVLAGLYVQDEIQAGPVLIVPGLRVDFESWLRIVSAGPRAAVRWQVVKPLVLKAAGGLYSRSPDPDEMIEPFGNKGLEYEQAVHGIGGLEWNITDTIFLDVQGYYKHMFNLVSRIQDPEPGGNKIYENGAKGYVFGGEVLLRHNWTDNFFGWISYSISRAMRNDGPGTEYRRFDRDQTHNLVAVASWQFAKGWRIGGRFQYTSGEPYTNITGSIFNADNGTSLPLYDEANKNSMTMPDYHRLDLRLDKEWLFDKWILDTYLEVQNVYYHKNPVSSIHNYDYSESGYFRSYPILPSIGIRAEF